MDGLIVLAFLFFVFRRVGGWIEKAGNKGSTSGTGNTGNPSGGEAVSKPKVGFRVQEIFDQIEGFGADRWKEANASLQKAIGEIPKMEKTFSYFPQQVEKPVAEPVSHEEGLHYEGLHYEGIAYQPLGHEALSYQSLEGRDTCDPALGHNRERMESPLREEELTQATGSFLDFTGDALVRSVVMSEILTRPRPRSRRSR